MSDDILDDEVAAVTYDQDDDSVVVIIGSGAGGGTLADELSQNGIDVVVLEAGPRFKDTDFVNDEWAMYDRFTWKDRRHSTGTSPIAQNFADAPTWICKGVGGTTLHWAAMCPRFQPHEFKARTTYGEIAGASLADWPISYDDVLPYYIRAEDKMGVSGRNGIALHPANNGYRVMAHGARRVGYRDFDTNNLAINVEPRDGRNGCDQIGFCMQGCKSGAKWSTFNSELPRAEATGRCEIRPECMVLRIEHNGAGRADGVVYVDRDVNQHRQKARLVCVAGNSIETARLLLNSESSQFPDGLANSSGLVGKNYMRHMFGFVYAEFDKPVHMHRGIIVGGIIRDEAGHDDSRGFVGGYYTGSIGLGLSFYAAFLDPNGWGRDYTDWVAAYDNIAAMQILGEDMPMETNRVSLHGSEKDQYGLPIPSLHLDDHPNEIRMKNHAYRKTAALMEAAGARRVFESPPLPASHNLGTCRMSDDAQAGVVNKWGQSHDLANLFVSDGSQFTSSMAGNPTLTIVALAIRQAEYITEQMRGNEI